MNKKLTILLVVIVLLIGGGVWVWRERTIVPFVPPLADTSSTDTSNWKTTINRKYGYTLQYPPTMLVDYVEPLLASPDESQELIILDGASGHYRVVFSVTVIDQATTTSSKEFVDILHYREEQPEHNPNLLWKRVGPVEAILVPGNDLTIYQYGVIRAFEGGRNLATQLRPAIVGNGSSILSLGFDNEDPVAVSILNSFQFIDSH